MKVRNFSKRVFIGLASLTAATLILGLTAAPADAATRIKWPTTYDPSYPIIDAAAGGTSVVGNGGVLILENYVTATSYYPGHLPNAHVVIQRRIGSGKWTTIWKHTYKATKKSISIDYKTPAYSTKLSSVVVSYRYGALAYNAGGGKGVPHSKYSASVKIKYENQSKYTGMQKEAYNIVKPYCPNTAVHIISTTGDEAGNYGTGNLLINVGKIVATLTPAFRETLYLHECTHEREFINYGYTYAGWEQMTKATDKHFIDDPTPAGVTPPAGGGGSVGEAGFTSWEHAADCAALSIDPEGYLGYGGYCNPSELHYAHLLITGHKI